MSVVIGNICQYVKSFNTLNTKQQKIPVMSIWFSQEVKSLRFETDITCCISRVDNLIESNILINNYFSSKFHKYVARLLQLNMTLICKTNYLF